MRFPASALFRPAAPLSLAGLRGLTVCVSTVALPGRWAGAPWRFSTLLLSGRVPPPARPAAAIAAVFARVHRVHGAASAQPPQDGPDAAGQQDGRGRGSFQRGGSLRGTKLRTAGVRPKPGRSTFFFGCFFFFKIWQTKQHGTKAGAVFQSALWYSLVAWTQLYKRG